MADPDHLFDEAVGYHQSGDLENARAGYSRLLSMQPNNSAVLHVLGIVCFQQNDLLDAEENLRAAIALTADDPTYHKNLGSVLKAQERWQEAVDELGEIVSVDAHYRDAAELLTQAGISLGEFKTLAAIMAPCSVNARGLTGENFRVSRWSQFVTTSRFSSLVGCRPQNCW